MKRKMSSEDRSDELLVRALEAGEACPSLERLAALAAGELDNAASLRIRTHAAGCARCQAELRLAESFFGEEADDAGDDPEVGAVAEALAAPTARWRGADAEAGPADDVSAPAGSGARGPASPRWYWRVAAALAVLVGGLLFLVDAPPELLPPPDPTSAVRASGLELLEPAGRVGEVPAELRWVPVEGATDYRVEVRRVDGSLVWSGTVSVPPATLPAPAREEIQPRARYNWSVSALGPDGRALTAPSSASFFLDPAPAP